jgi:hypothetical protein
LDCEERRKQDFFWGYRILPQYAESISCQDDQFKSLIRRFISKELQEFNLAYFGFKYGWLSSDSNVYKTVPGRVVALAISTSPDTSQMANNKYGKDSRMPEQSISNSAWSREDHEFYKAITYDCIRKLGSLDDVVNTLVETCRTIPPSSTIDTGNQFITEFITFTMDVGRYDLLMDLVSSRNGINRITDILLWYLRDSLRRSDIFYIFATHETTDYDAFRNLCYCLFEVFHQRLFHWSADWQIVYNINLIHNNMYYVVDVPLLNRGTLLYRTHQIFSDVKTGRIDPKHPNDFNFILSYIDLEYLRENDIDEYFYCLNQWENTFERWFREIDYPISKVSTIYQKHIDDYRNSITYE